VPAAAHAEFPGAGALRALVEGADEGMILADAAAIVQYASPAAAQLLGYTPAELRGRVGFDMCHPEHVPIARAAFGRCLADATRPVDLVLAIVRPDGATPTISVRLVNKLADAEVGAVVVHFRGTRRPREAPDEHYRAVFECAPIGLGVADMTGQLLLFNDAMMRPGGYTHEDIVAIGSVAKLYYNEEDRAKVLALAREQGFVFRLEVQFRAKSGEPYDTLLTLAPVRFDDRPCWLAAVEDITQQKRAESDKRRLEAQLQQAQKMEAVGRMTAGIAHDFNNVLAVILGSSQMLSDTLAQLPGPHLGDLEELRKAAQRGSDMVKKLLGYSRSAELRLAATDLAQLVEGQRGAWRHLVPPRLEIAVRAEPGSMALVDAAAVEQMVLNLITNARDAIAETGTIRVRVGSTVVDQPSTPWLPSGAYVRLSVADDGMGMDAVTRARVFEPFFTTKRHGAGTGLGLAMVYGLAKQQGGFVDVQSAPGQGTTVSLFFPRLART
jgi:PAS domain S-box-containing protein